MKAEPSKLAQLVIAYREKFGRHVPQSALRFRNAGGWAAMLQNSLATGVPFSETEWGGASPIELSPRGCIVREQIRQHATPKKGPDGEWLH